MSTKHEYGYTHAPCILSALKVIKVECVAVSSQNDCQGGSDIYNRTGPALYGYRITVSEPLGVPWVQLTTGNKAMTLEC